MKQGMARAGRRRGSIYLLVMGACALVALIGVASLMTARIQMKQAAAGADFATARLCARAGLEVAMYRIRTTPTWRTTLGNGAWYTNVPLGQGRFSVVAADPVSGDVTAASNHPVALTCTGTCGAAVYKMQATLQANPAGLSSLEVSLCSGDQLRLNSGTLTSDQTVSSGQNINVSSGSTINANAEAAGGFGGGGTYAKAKVRLLEARKLPDPVHVFDTYTAAGTAIPLAALYQSRNTQIVSNGGCEGAASPWYLYSRSSPGVAMGLTSAQKKDGSSSLLVSGRAGAGDVPAQDLAVASMRCGDVYAVDTWVYATSGGSVQGVIVLQTSTGTTSIATPATALKATGGWVNVKASVTVSWTGTLSRATLTFACTDNACDLYVDACSLTDTSLPDSAYRLDRVVLGPGSNPWGAANPQGIYVIDCANQDLTIGACRIVGTLVLLRAGGGTTIQGPICWETAIANYPALLCDGKLAISFDASVALSEASYGTNFNPAAAAFPYSGGTSDLDASDAYASQISGLVYSTLDMTFSLAPSIRGVVLSGGQINCNATSVNLSYSNVFYQKPPGGFGSTLPVITPVPGSWQRVAN